VAAPAFMRGRSFSAPKRSALHSLRLQPRLRALIRTYGQGPPQFKTLRIQFKRTISQEPHPWTSTVAAPRSQHRGRFRFRKECATRPKSVCSSRLCRFKSNERQVENRTLGRQMVAAARNQHRIRFKFKKGCATRPCAAMTGSFVGSSFASNNGDFVRKENILFGVLFRGHHCG